jgi:hypothetical protein
MSKLTNEEQAINVLIQAVDALVSKKDLNLSDLMVVVNAINILRPSTPEEENNVDPKEQESLEEM